MASKLVVITGASSGIGEATAKRYGAEGAHVLLLARNAERLYGVAHAIREAGGAATAFPIDLVGSEAVKELTARIEGEIGTPDLLVNNAGAGRWLPLLETAPDDARAAIDVPYLAAFNITRALAPAMIARRSGGIVFITSPASYLAWPNASAYIAARRALAGFAETLQVELKATGLVVTLVVLGNVTGTAYWEHNPGSREHLLRPYPALIPDITAGRAAEVILAGAEEGKRFVVEPWQYRVLFLLNALFPKTTASQIRRIAKTYTAKAR